MQLFKWMQSEDGSRELTNECSHVGHVLALYIVTRGDFVIVGGYPTLREYGVLNYLNVWVDLLFRGSWVAYWHFAVEAMLNGMAVGCAPRELCIVPIRVTLFSPCSVHIRLIGSNGSGAVNMSVKVPLTHTEPCADRRPDAEHAAADLPGG